jgi:hypothetical protein
MAATMMASAQQVFEVKQLGPSQLLLSSPGVSRAQHQHNPGPNRVDLRSLPLASRLSCIPGALAQRFEPGTLALVQVREAKRVR